MHESLKHLRLDRRLLVRRHWIRDKEREKEFASLPDCADKAVPLCEEEEDAEADASD